jgi:hypothetical protein
LGSFSYCLIYVREYLLLLLHWLPLNILILKGEFFVHWIYLDSLIKNIDLWDQWYKKLF